MNVTVEKARIVAEQDGVELGEMTFVDSGSFYIVDHTGVSDTARGLGVGKKLMAKMAEFAREQEKKILPLCPFAKAEMEKTSEYHNLIK